MFLKYVHIFSQEGFWLCSAQKMDNVHLMSNFSVLCFVQEVQWITLNLIDYIKLKPHSQGEISAYSLAVLQSSLAQDVNSSQVQLTYFENLFFR